MAISGEKSKCGKILKGESDDAIRIIFFDRCPIFSDVKVNFRYLFMWFGFHIFVLPNFKLFLL